MARKKVKYFTFGPYLYDTPNNAFEVFDNTSGAIQLTVEHDGIACSAWTADKLLMTGGVNGIPKAETGNLADIVTSSDSSITISANDIIVAQSGISKTVLYGADLDGEYTDITLFSDTFASNRPAPIGRALVIAHNWSGSALTATVEGWIEFFYSLNTQASGPSITKIAADADSDVLVGNGTGLSNSGIRVYNYSSGNQLRLGNETGTHVKWRVVWWDLTT
jgi:hypothetical protein